MNQPFERIEICAVLQGDGNRRFFQNNSGCESEAALGFRFASGLPHGVTTIGPANGWKSHLPFPASHSAISTGRSSAGILSWIVAISGEEVVVTIEWQGPGSPFS